MNFICPHCGNNAFHIRTEHVGAQHAECMRCSEIIPFAESEMEPTTQSRRRRSAIRGTARGTWVREGV